jgi:hypothetical protein
VVKKIIIITSVLVVTASVVGVSYVFLRKSQNNLTPIAQQRQEKETGKVRREKEQVAIIPEKPEIDTSDWKTYRNEKYGFEVKLPSNWMEQKIFSEIDPLKGSVVFMEENIFGEIVSSLENGVAFFISPTGPSKPIPIPEGADEVNSRAFNLGGQPAIRTDYIFTNIVDYSKDVTVDIRFSPQAVLPKYWTKQAEISATTPLEKLPVLEGVLQSLKFYTVP